MPTNKNVELEGRDGLKLFPHGICCYFIPNLTRINGGWWISIARHLRMFYCFTNLVGNASKIIFGEALTMVLEAHHMTRNPVRKDQINEYKKHMEKCVEVVIHICAPSTASGCNSIKFHQPVHRYLTRIEIGCSAMEKSLEKMLGESQKKPFKHTNAKFDVEVVLINEVHIKCAFNLNTMRINNA